MNLYPVHPVYARIEDARERDDSAEEYAAQEVLGVECEYIALLRQRQEKDYLIAVKESIQDLIRDAYIAGWDAARDEQSRP